MLFNSGAPLDVAPTEARSLISGSETGSALCIDTVVECRKCGRKGRWSAMVRHFRAKHVKPEHQHHYCTAYDFGTSQKRSMETHFLSKSHRHKAKGRGMAECFRLGLVRAIRFSDCREDNSRDLQTLSWEEVRVFETETKTRTSFRSLMRTLMHQHPALWRKTLMCGLWSPTLSYRQTMRVQMDWAPKITQGSPRRGRDYFGHTRGAPGLHNQCRGSCRVGSSVGTPALHLQDGDNGRVIPSCKGPGGEFPVLLH